MKILLVRSRRGNYPVLIGRGILQKAGARLRRLGLEGKVLVVTQEPVARFHLKKVERSLARSGYRVRVHMLPDGETAKSKDELFKIYRSLLDHDFERRDTVLALGGGVAGDLAGFAAATFLRGLAFVNAGTTLLAQVDSSIGGKTGINLGEGKNLVGAFYPPRLVISDAEALETLPPRELIASLAEAVKCGVIRDARLFWLLETQFEQILDKDPGILEKIVIASARVKAGVVGRDEYETKGERMILNFGHTFGHAFERVLNYRRLMHGEAVAIGMVCAARLAEALGGFAGTEVRRLIGVLERLHLPASLSGLDLEAGDILSAMMRDKKKRAGRLRFVLPARIGRVVVRGDIPLAKVRKVLRECGARR